MSGTSAIIAIKTNEGYKAIYNNYDSSNLLWLLSEKYNTEEIVNSIVERGNASYIGCDLNKTEKEAIYYGYYSTFYNEWRPEEKGEGYNEPVIYSNLKKLLAIGMNEPYLFIFEGGEWYVTGMYPNYDGETDTEHNRYLKPVLLKTYIEENYTEEEAFNKKIMLFRKEKKAVIFEYENKTQKEKNKVIKYLKEKYLNRENDSDYYTLINEDDNSFNVTLIISYKKAKYYDRY